MELCEALLAGELLATGAAIAAAAAAATPAAACAPAAAAAPAVTTAGATVPTANGPTDGEALEAAISSVGPLMALADECGLERLQGVAMQFVSASMR